MASSPGSYYIHRKRIEDQSLQAPVIVVPIWWFAATSAEVSRACSETFRCQPHVDLTWRDSGFARARNTDRRRSGAWVRCWQRGDDARRAPALRDVRDRRVGNARPRCVERSAEPREHDGDRSAHAAIPRVIAASSGRQPAATPVQLIAWPRHIRYFARCIDPVCRPSYVVWQRRLMDHEQHR